MAMPAVLRHITRSLCRVCYFCLLSRSGGAVFDLRVMARHGVVLLEEDVREGVRLRIDVAWMSSERTSMLGSE